MSSYALRGLEIVAIGAGPNGEDIGVVAFDVFLGERANHDLRLITINPYFTWDKYGFDRQEIDIHQLQPRTSYGALEARAREIIASLSEVASLYSRDLEFSYEEEINLEKATRIVMDQLLLDETWTDPSKAGARILAGRLQIPVFGRRHGKELYRHQGKLRLFTWEG